MMKKSPATLFQEIQEQPELFQTLLAQPQDWLGALPPLPAGTQKIVALAEGSSKNALAIAAPFIEAWTGLPMWIYDPEALEEKFAISQLFHAQLASVFQDTYFIAVSQSGQTASVLRILETLQAQLSPSNFHLLAITNRKESTLSTLADHSLWIGAGEEKSIAATKTMTASVLTLLLWGLHTGHQSGHLCTETFQSIIAQLQQLPQAIETLWEARTLKAILQFTRKLVEMNHFVLLSKGPLTLILPEVGLKLTETSSNIVYTDNSESFKHGPKVILSGVQGQHPNSIYVVPTDPETAEGLFKDIRSHFWHTDDAGEMTLTFEDDRVFFIAFENSPPIPVEIREGLSIREDKILTLPSAQHLLDSLFMGIITFQLMSYDLAMIKGEDPNNPALEKAVTQ